MSLPTESECCHAGDVATADNSQREPLDAKGGDRERFVMVPSGVLRDAAELGAVGIGCFAVLCKLVEDKGADPDSHVVAEDVAKLANCATKTAQRKLQKLVELQHVGRGSSKRFPTYSICKGGQFVRVPERLINDAPTIGLHAVACFVAVLSHDNPRGEIYPALRTIEAKAGCGRDKVVRSIKRLEWNGYLFVGHAESCRNRYFTRVALETLAKELRATPQEVMTAADFAQVRPRMSLESVLYFTAEDIPALRLQFPGRESQRDSTEPPKGLDRTTKGTLQNRQRDSTEPPKGLKSGSKGTQKVLQRDSTEPTSQPEEPKEPTKPTRSEPEGGGGWDQICEAWRERIGQIRTLIDEARATGESPDKFLARLNEAWEVATYHRNARLIRTVPGAVVYRMRNKTWPDEGVIDPKSANAPQSRVLNASQESERHRRELKPLVDRFMGRVRALRSEGKSDEQIAVILATEFRREVFQAMNWTFPTDQENAA